MLELHARRELNGNSYDAQPVVDCRVRGLGTGDSWEFRVDAEKRQIDNVLRWFVEINLFSQSVSNLLRVTEVSLDVSASPDWVLRKAETGDVAFTGFSSTQALPSLPKMNTNWQFFSKAAASGAVPNVRLLFRMLC
jgi:hypothetical protein